MKGVKIICKPPILKRCAVNLCTLINKSFPKKGNAIKNNCFVREGLG